MTIKTNYMFLLSASPWPLISSMSAFNLLFSLLIFLKFGSLNSFLLSVLLVSLTSFCWWMNYSSEMGFKGGFALSLERGLKVSMILFISSEVFFFFSFFWAYFHFFLSPTLEISGVWPPMQVLSFDFLNVPLINTLILLTSGVTVTISHFFLMANRISLFSSSLALTIFLGLIFSALQGLEYGSSFFSISDGNFGTSFFMLTGFHGIHVMIGALYLLTSLIRSYLFASSNENLLSFELASWYWHFVDVVWIFLYFFLYYLNS